MNEHCRKLNALKELYLAIRANKPKLVLFTLRRHRNLNINSNLMRTSALLLAVRNQNETIVRILLHHNCELNKLSPDESGRLETPLYTAVRLHNYNIVELLLMFGADPNVTVSDNRTPLYTATKEGCFNICHLLIEYGANLDIPDCMGQTPLHLACRNINGREQIALLLIAHGANLNAVDFKRRFPLDFAEANCSKSTIESLIEDGSPISKHLKERIRCLMQSKLEQRAWMISQSDGLSIIIKKTRLEVPTLLILSKARIRILLRRRAKRIGNTYSIWPLVDSLTMLSASLRNSLKLLESFQPEYCNS
ncbi:unnamed protein product [Thelazia callipaeda]|uniref:ANK_REP_REGION domain-containing protein n=1 Tax=Thelazia callipaeda TaxID=103827 RepID=A0A0N5CNK6_THECL|nr:unnamed protein product [Thelazia callipaeda]